VTGLDVYALQCYVVQQLLIGIGADVIMLSTTMLMAPELV
jgi:hypothetical protein